MPQKDLKKYLLDVLQAIEGIEQISAALLYFERGKKENWLLNKELPNPSLEAWGDKNTLVLALA